MLIKSQIGISQRYNMEICTKFYKNAIQTLMGQRDSTMHRVIVLSTNPGLIINNPYGYLHPSRSDPCMQGNEKA